MIQRFTAIIERDDDTYVALGPLLEVPIEENPPADLDPLLRDDVVSASAGSALATEPIRLAGSITSQTRITGQLPQNCAQATPQNAGNFANRAVRVK